MTEFEMAYLAQEMTINRTAQASLIISIMSAFLVVGYTAAHRLTFALNALIVALYSLLLFQRIGAIPNGPVNRTEIARPATRR